MRLNKSLSAFIFLFFNDTLGSAHMLAKVHSIEREQQKVTINTYKAFDENGDLVAQIVDKAVYIKPLGFAKCYNEIGELIGAESIRANEANELLQSLRNLYYSAPTENQAAGRVILNR